MDERIGTFIDEADAYTQCEAAGYVAMKFDFPAEENEFHWHDFDSLTFITGGELTVFDVDSGESRTCSSGTKLVVERVWFIERKARVTVPSSGLLSTLKP